MWFCRELGIGQSAFAALNKYAFVLLFFVVRVVGLPALTWHVHQHEWELIKSFPLLSAALVALCLLQLYWFVLIVQKFLGHDAGADAKQGGDKKKTKSQ